MSLWWWCGLVTDLLLLRSRVYDTIALCRYASANMQVAVTTHLFFVVFLRWYSINWCEYGWFYQKNPALLTEWNLVLKQMNTFVLFPCSYLDSVGLWSSGCHSAGLPAVHASSLSILLLKLGSLAGWREESTLVTSRYWDSFLSQISQVFGWFLADTSVR